MISEQNAVLFRKLLYIKNIVPQEQSTNFFVRSIVYFCFWSEQRRKPPAFAALELES